MPLTEEKVAAGFKAAGDKFKDIESSVAEQRAAINMLLKQLRRLGQQLSEGAAATGGYPGFWGSEERASAFGDILLKVIKGPKSVEYPLYDKAMGEGAATGGGNLVPSELGAWLIDKMGRYGKFRKWATRVPMGGDRLEVPRITSDLTVYCPGEGNAITPSDVEVGQVGLNARKLAALCNCSNELEQDSIIALAEIVGMSMARSMARAEDSIGFIGDGTSTYFGMTGLVGALRGVNETIANIAGLAVASGNTYAEITLANFKSVVALLPEEADDGSRWYMSRKFFFSVVWPLAETAGVANIFEILSDRKGHYLLGYPVEFVSCMPSTQANSQICAVLGDLQLGAYLGERRQLGIDRSEHVLFGNDQVSFRGIERISISAHGVGDTSEAGPIVGLITAGS